MSQQLDERDFDYVVLGTGLTESILAAALAYAGLRVLHLDPNPFYGSTSSTVSLEVLIDILTSIDRLDDEPPRILPDRELAEGSELHFMRTIPFHGVVFPFGHATVVPASEDELPTKKILIDLTPRTLLASGALVDLMVRTNVGNYLDFRALEATYVAFDDDGLRRVPSSRADVFQDRFITMLEKRLLMRFVKTTAAAPPPPPSSASSSDDDVLPSDVSFEEYMRVAGLTEKLKTFLHHAVALADTEPQNMAASVARQAVAQYHASVARYRTPTPFLVPNYGSAEISQAFCRLCAVQGGTYVLRRGVRAVVTNDTDGTLEGVVTDTGEVVKCRRLFASASVGKDIRASPAPSKVWRAACVVDGSIVEGSHGRNMLFVPKGTLGNDSASVRVLQVDNAVGVCPNGMFVVHAWTIGLDGTKADVINVLKRYVRFNDVADAEIGVDEDAVKTSSVPEDGVPPSCEATRKPRMLWGIVYAREAWSSPGMVESHVNGVYLLPEGAAEPDAEFCVKAAKLAFEDASPVPFFERVDEADDEDEESIEGDEGGVVNGVSETSADGTTEKNITNLKEDEGTTSA